MRYFFSVRSFQIVVQLKSLAIQPTMERFIEGDISENRLHTDQELHIAFISF